MRYSVIQIGARRNYAVPALLQKAGLLERFYTDLCSDVGLGRMAQAGKSLPLAGPKLARLAGRRLPPGLAARTTTFAGPVLSQAIRLAFAKSDGERYRAHIRWNNAFGKAIADAGFGAATHLYSMLGEGGCALRAARDRGLQVATDIYILLSSDSIVAAERREFPGWEADSPDYEETRRESRPDETMLENTGLAICPAESVREDLVRNFAFPRERTAVVPFGVGAEWLEYENRPQPGRILFAGTACLRKGIQYFAMAAELLSKRGLRCDFRVAGDNTPEIVGQPLCARLNFLGRVPRHRMREEFESADLMVLPTLAEGSAGVTYQALAVGLPVITTDAAGSVVRDRIEGRIVAPRDPAQLAEAIAELLENRPLRDRYAHAARERARDYTWERYGDRLIEALA